MDGAPRVSRLGRFARGRRPDRNPLRRASDLVETGVLALLIVAFGAAAPFVARESGAWAHAASHRIQFAQRASRHQVSAGRGAEGGAGAWGGGRRRVRPHADGPGAMAGAGRPDDDR